MPQAEHVHLVRALQEPEARPTDKYFQWVQSNGLGALATSWKKDSRD